MSKSSSERIVAYLEKLASKKQPQKLAVRLSGERFKRLWRWRVGDYRIISCIDQKNKIITVVMIGHRKEVYR